MSSILGTSLRNPAPTSGAIRKGAIPSTQVATRKRTLPTVASLQNPSMRTSVTDLQTNSTAAAPLFCRPFQKSWEKHYDEGDILFVKAEDVAANSRNQFHIVANLPVLNTLLRETRNSVLGNMANGPQSGKRRYSADAEGLRNLLTDWHFFGVMLNDMDTGSQYQRLLNVTVRGRCRLPNYWSHDAGAAFSAFGGNRRLTKGSICWIGFKKTSHNSDSIVLEPDGARKLVPATYAPGRGPGGLIGDEEYWQAIPVLEPPHSGTANGQMGNADFNDCAHKIPIGVIHHLPYKNTPLKRQYEARFSTDQGKLLDRMEVFVRI